LGGHVGGGGVQVVFRLQDRLREVVLVVEGGLGVVRPRIRVLLLDELVLLAVVIRRVVQRRGGKGAVRGRRVFWDRIGVLRGGVACLGLRGAQLGLCIRDISLGPLWRGRLAGVAGPCAIRVVQRLLKRAVCSLEPRARKCRLCRKVRRRVEHVGCMLRTTMAMVASSHQQPARPANRVTLENLRSGSRISGH
jgi:hypothetical protein